METLQLVGYTADLRYLVFSDASRGGAQLRVPVDDDLIGTFDEIVDLLRPPRRAEAPPIAPVAQPTPAPAPPVAEAPDEPATPPEPEPEPEPDEVEEPEEIDLRPRPGKGVLAGLAIISATPPAELPSEVVRPRQSELSPREIQARLRAGADPRAIAREAGTTAAWVERWLPPIEAEREQVEAAVRGSVISRRRLGESADPVGQAVRTNLEARGLDPDDPDAVRWQTVRREGDSYWSVSVRFRHRGKLQRALYRWDVDEAALDPRNDLALDLGFTRPGGRPSTAGRKRSSKELEAGPPDEPTPDTAPEPASQPSGPPPEGGVADPALPAPGEMAPRESAPGQAASGEALPGEASLVEEDPRPAGRGRAPDAPPLVIVTRAAPTPDPPVAAADQDESEHDQQRGTAAGADSASAS